jgi:hypothetical protein
VLGSDASLSSILSPRPSRRAQSKVDELSSDKWIDLEAQLNPCVNQSPPIEPEPADLSRIDNFDRVVPFQSQFGSSKVNLKTISKYSVNNIANLNPYKLAMLYIRISYVPLIYIGKSNSRISFCITQRIK